MSKLRSAVYGFAIGDALGVPYEFKERHTYNCTDVGKAAGRVTNRAFGFSDTVSDGFWTMVRASTSDTESTAREIIASALLDKNLKKKKKETKKGQVKDAQTRYLEMKEKERKRKEKKSKEQK